jgi:hypothetical protein
MRVVGWTAVALVWCLLTACGHGDSSSAGPLPGSTASTTQTSTPVDPSPSPDIQTPEEFVRAWVAEYNAMQNTGDTKKFRSMSRQCTTCAKVADRMDRYYAAGGYVKTDGLTITRLRVSKANAKGQCAATIHVNAAPTEYVEKSGGPVLKLPGGHPILQLSIQLRNSSWNTFDIAQVAQ